MWNTQVREYVPPPLAVLKIKVLSVFSISFYRTCQLQRQKFKESKGVKTYCVTPSKSINTIREQPFLAKSLIYLGSILKSSRDNNVRPYQF